MTTADRAEDDQWAERYRAAMDLWKAGDVEAALAPMRAALKLRPQHRITQSAAAAMLTDMQLGERAERALRPIVEQRPEDDLSHYRLAHALLQQGRLAEAWPHWEHREHRLENKYLGKLSEWQGEPLEGRSILVIGEQGLGDEIQFARFIPELRRRGASRITVGCHPLNVRAFGQLGADEVFDRLETEAVRRHDFWALFGSLPRWLGVDLANLSASSYLTAPAQGRGGIGLVGRGSPGHAADSIRSLPAGLLSRTIREGRELTPAGDVLDSLSQIAALDLLITVDTSWAHMAGALGVPVWVLLPKYYLDWRWLRGREDSPWYASARLFRQERPGDWASVLAEVRQALDGARSGQAVT